MKDKILALLKEINEEVINYEGEDYFADDILDSLSIVDLVAELEDCFDIEIDAKYIIEEHFKSIDAIISLINKIKNVNK